MKSELCISFRAGSHYSLYHSWLGRWEADVDKGESIMKFEKGHRLEKKKVYSTRTIHEKILDVLKSWVTFVRESLEGLIHTKQKSKKIPIVRSL